MKTYVHWLVFVVVQTVLCDIWAAAIETIIETCQAWATL